MPGEVVAGWFAFRDGAAEMGTTHGDMGEVVRAERTDHRAGVAWESGLVSGEFDEERRNRDAGGAANEVGIRAEP